MTQKQALQILKMGSNVFLTGQAGSGKTYLLNKYITFLKKYGVGIGITASTGVAATHMGGKTIHSWAGLGIKDAFSHRDLSILRNSKRLQRQFKKTKVLIIDEISMLQACRLDMVDKVCRIFLNSRLPFGGLQVILAGDFFQLPPVGQRGQELDQFVYQSQIWQKMNLKICYLQEQFRQEDEDYLTVLNAIRSNAVNEAIVDLLYQRYQGVIKGIKKPTRLYTHNINVDSLNYREIEKINKPAKTFLMSAKGPKTLTDALKKGSLAAEQLVLKKGAQVMFTKNNFQKGYVNGTLGRVVDFKLNGAPIVQTLKGKKIAVAAEKWSIQENEKEMAWIIQLPLRLAWAITVHKSQGMSLDAAEIDLSRAFEPGMGYVALSRVRTLQGVRLLGLNTLALRINKQVLEFDKKLQSDAQKVIRQLQALNRKEIKQRQNAFLKFIGVNKAKKVSSTNGKTALMHS